MKRPEPKTLPSPDLGDVIRSRVANFVTRHRLPVTEPDLLIGFSGGADSTALLLLLHDLNPNLTAVHLHHGIRGPDADHDAAWCARFCQARKIRFEQHKLAVPTHRRPGEGIEEAARRRRLDFWASRTGSGGAVALGHHTDDQLEDLFLRLIRGSNCSGLAGLRPFRTIRGVRIIRPLLCLRREEIEDFLRSQGIRNWRRDRTNTDCHLRRNAIRRRLLPLIRRLAGNDQGVLTSLAAIQMDADFIENQAQARVKAVASLHELRGLHPAILPRALRGWLRDEIGEDTIPGHDTLERLRQILVRHDRHPWQIPIGHGLVLARTGDRITVLHGHTTVLAPRQWEWRKEPRLELSEAGIALHAELLSPGTDRRPVPAGNGECFLADELPARLTVRAWLAGDRMVPFGSNHPKKLQDLFTDARIPRWRRPLIPLLLADDRIVWVPGVRRAEFGRISEFDCPDRPVVRLTVETTD